MGQYAAFVSVAVIADDRMSRRAAADEGGVRMIAGLHMGIGVAPADRFAIGRKGGAEHRRSTLVHPSV